MSAQAGIFYFDGRPIEPDVPARLNAQLAAFGPDGGGQHVAPGLVMVSRALHVTPEDRLEHQPYVSACRNVMTWNGRLDNREDLLLQLWRELRDDTTDVAIAMAAYERWGREAFARLVGDWSVAIFDATEQSIVLASDYLGVRPMYYSQTNRMLVWSSSLALLVRECGRSPEINPHFVFGELVGCPKPNGTPYRNIVSLSPAHILVQRRSGLITTTRFWRAGLARIDYRHHAQYVEHFQQVFERAILARLRAAGPVWCEVSGGLDSSSVACMAHALTSYGRSAASLRFVSYVSDLSPESDERRFATEVQSHCDVPTHYLESENRTLLQPGHWSGPVIRSSVFADVARLMSADGARVILSGRVGDATMGNFASDHGNLSRLLATGRFHEFLTQARAWSRASQDPILWVIARSLQWFLPAKVRLRQAHASHLQEYGGRSDANTLAAAFSVDARFAAAHSLTHMDVIDAALHGDAPRNPAVLRNIYEYAFRRRLQLCSTTPYMVWSYPYVDRQLVEFVTAIPFNVLCPAGHPRAIMKEALAGILPPRIHRRFSKGYAAPYVIRALRPYALDFSKRLRQLQLVQRGFVDPVLLGQRLERLLNGSLTTIGNLVSICAMELWLDAYDSHINREAAPSTASTGFTRAQSTVDAITLRSGAVA